VRKVVMKKRNSIQTMARFIAIVAVFQIVFIGSVWAQEENNDRRRIVPSPETVKTESLNLKIIGKTPKVIRTKNIDFVVIDSTEVVDAKGKLMSLEALPVPCRATIQYEPGRLNNHLVWRVIFRAALPGATTAWSPPREE
jgi:hypothetical protein